MHRQSLLALLWDYALRHPEEASTVSRFVDFVNAHARCFDRDLWEGHVTGSAWVTDRLGKRVLLTHHRKLGRWMQLGGHSDGNPDPLQVALQEAHEESGLEVRPLEPTIFDLDIHVIPARKLEPAHLHYDVRFALQVVGNEAFRVSEESLDLAWIPLGRIEAYSGEESVLRMARKWRMNGNSPGRSP